MINVPLMLFECFADGCIPPEGDLCLVPLLTLNDVASPPQVALLFSAKFIWNPTAWSLHRSENRITHLYIPFAFLYETYLFV